MFRRDGQQEAARIADLERTALPLRVVRFRFERDASVSGPLGDFVEPGRGIAADAGELVATVIGVVQRAQTRWVFLDAGVFTGLVETLEEAIRYPLNHRDGLLRFLDDGRIELDTNTVERAIRPLCLSRKNALFASGDDGGARWAAVASLVETCKLNGVDPQRYFADLLTRLVNGWPNRRIDELMPWRWATAENS